MTPRIPDSDLPRDMPRLHVFGSQLHLDDGTAEQMLEGHLDPGDAPHGLTHVAALLARVGTERESVHPEPNPGLVAAMARTLQGTGAPAPVPASHVKEKPMLGKIISFKIGTAVATAILGAGSAAAAATGSLPTPVQSTVSQLLSHVGISVPAPPASHGGGAGSSTPVSTTATTAPVTTVAPGSGTATSGTSGNGAPPTSVPAPIPVLPGSGTATVGTFGGPPTSHPGKTEGSQPPETQTTEPVQAPEPTEPPETQTTEKPSSGDSGGGSGDSSGGDHGDSGNSTSTSSGSGAGGSGPSTTVSGGDHGDSGGAHGDSGGSPTTGTGGSSTSTSVPTGGGGGGD